MTPNTTSLPSYDRVLPLQARSTARYGVAPAASMAELVNAKQVLDPLTTRVERFFTKYIAPNRTQEMLIEDLLGFGGLRTALDLMRNRIYGGRDKQTLDFPTARERLMRETLSIITDNVASGVVAYGVGRVLDKHFNAFSNTFISFPVLEAFQSLASSSKTEADFLQQLVKQLAPNNPTTQAALTKAMAPLSAHPWSTWAKPKNLPLQQQQYWQQLPYVMARHLKQNHHLVSLGDAAASKSAINTLARKNEAIVTTDLPNLLSDMAAFLGHLQHNVQPGTGKALALPWQQQAQAALANTLQVKYLKLACLSVGFLLTFMVPYGIRAITRRLDKEDTYPGERGLKFAAQAPVGSSVGLPLGSAGAVSIKAKPTATIATDSNLSARHSQRAFTGFDPSTASTPHNGEWWFPYLVKSIHRGNTLPMVMSMIPLLFTFGLFDTVTRRFKNPFAPGFFKYLRNAYDFGKGFPFTTQQQMASMYAFLITSRLSSTRSGNEFRERVVDSFLSWSLWILGTPLIKRAVSQVLDRTQGTQLVDATSKRLRTRAEIQHLIQDGGKTLSRHVWIGALSTVATIIMLGLVEPYLAILWTKRNAQKQQKQTENPIETPKAV
jgi:hypothetical protein